jgi:hypothetical protein
MDDGHHRAAIAQFGVSANAQGVHVDFRRVSATLEMADVVHDSKVDGVAYPRAAISGSASDVSRVRLSLETQGLPASEAGISGESRAIRGPRGSPARLSA